MDLEKLETWKMNLLGETLLFGLLGKILYQDPDRGLLDSLIAEEVFTESPFGGGWPEIDNGLATLQRWARENPDGVSPAEFERIQSDHLYLFTGVGKALAPIYESMYFNPGRLIFQKETLDVRNWYARFELQPERLNREPDDHLGLEFTFVSHLAGRAVEALEAGEHVEFEAALQAQRDFLAGHLLLWAPAWAGLVGDHARTDFYRGLALLADGALRAAAGMLGLPVPPPAA